MTSQVSGRSTRIDDNTSALIGVDWGTTSCRAYLFDADGAIIDSRADGHGTLSLTARGATAFDAELTRLVGDWAHERAVPIIACGMVGSAQGWAEAHYASLPADLADVPARAARVASRLGTVTILPGVMQPARDGRWPDVMRGEETQLLGVADALPDRGRRTVILPGTHTKWADLDGTRITGFTTTMTGETFALLLGHSLLGQLARRGTDAPGAFDRGVRTTLGGGGSLLATVFSARTLALQGDLDAHAVPDYLSGLLIGDEVRALAPRIERAPVILCGAPELTQRYARALALHDVASIVAPQTTTARGLWAAAALLGLVTEGEHRA